MQRLFRGYDWMDDAACAGHPQPDIWYPETKNLYTRETREAQAICASCPVTMECYRYGLGEPYGGIYGGVLLAGGKPSPIPLPPLPPDATPRWNRRRPVAAKRVIAKPVVLPVQRKPLPVETVIRVVDPPSAPGPEPVLVAAAPAAPEEPVAREQEPTGLAGVFRRVWRTVNWW